MKRGLLLFGHGSKSDGWNQPIISIEEKFRSIFSDIPVRSAFMKYTNPSIDDMVESLAKENISKITVIPVFIATGSHTVKDFPKILERLSSKYPDIEFDLKPSIGEWDSFKDFMVEIIYKSL